MHSGGGMILLGFWNEIVGSIFIIIIIRYKILS